MSLTNDELRVLCQYIERDSDNRCQLKAIPDNVQDIQILLSLDEKYLQTYGEHVADNVQGLENALFHVTKALPDDPEHPRRTCIRLTEDEAAELLREYKREFNRKWWQKKEYLTLQIVEHLGRVEDYCYAFRCAATGVEYSRKEDMPIYVVFDSGNIRCIPRN